MNRLRPHHVSVKTDVYGRPLCFAWCDDNGIDDDSITLDGWVSSWDSDGGAGAEWIVRSAQGDVFRLQRGDNATGQSIGEVWTARRVEERQSSKPLSDVEVVVHGEKGFFPMNG